MKLITWNVNGLRAVLKKGFSENFSALGADIFCLQEIKMQAGQAELDLPEYEIFYNYAEKKGYSGTAVFTKIKPLSVAYDFADNLQNTIINEGRVITLEFENFYLVNAYVPNSQNELQRLDGRMAWEDALRGHLTGLDKIKPVIYCGDLNVAHKEIDLKNPKTNTHNAGFTAEERGKLTELLGCGFVDVFRKLYPDKTGAYTWWSYLRNARENNAGWRIDYFLVSERIAGDVEDCVIHSDVFGSDHCPVELVINAKR
jgi:exodeoxyribonuclease-3